MKKFILIVGLLLSLLGCEEIQKDYIQAAKSHALEEAIQLQNQTLFSTGDLAYYYLEELTGATREEIRRKAKFAIEGDWGEKAKIVRLSFQDAYVQIPVKEEGRDLVIDLPNMVGYCRGKRFGNLEMTQKIIVDKIQQLPELLPAVIENIFNK